MLNFRNNFVIFKTPYAVRRLLFYAAASNHERISWEAGKLDKLGKLETGRRTGWKLEKFSDGSISVKLGLEYVATRIQPGKSWAGLDNPCKLGKLGKPTFRACIFSGANLGKLGKIFFAYAIVYSILYTESNI